MHQAACRDGAIAAAVKRSAVPIAPTAKKPAECVCFRQIAQRACKSSRIRNGARGWQTCCSAHQPPPLAGPAPKKRLAVFVSGGGSNFKHIQHACEDGYINGSVVVVVTDKPNCKGVAFAESLNIPVLVYPSPKTPVPGRHCLTDEQLVQSLSAEYEVDVVLLAGYLKLVPAVLVKQYPRAMLNIHPGLLPAFGGKGMYGQRVHQAVIQSGARDHRADPTCNPGSMLLHDLVARIAAAIGTQSYIRFSGPTVHFVDEIYDHGPILAQACVPVHPLETAASLAARVLSQEHVLYREAVAALCDERITWREDGVPILWTAR